MKKCMVLAVCLALAGALAVNSTLADDLDRVFKNVADWIANQTLGAPTENAEFEVSLLNQARVNGSLEALSQSPALIPCTSGMPTQTETVTLGGFNYQLWPAASVPHAIDKFVSVVNKSKSQIEEGNRNDAYFRVAIAVDARLHSLLHLNRNQQDFVWSDWTDITTKDGRAYKMIVATYNEKLPAGETSPAALMQVALDYATTNADVENVSSDFLKIQVLSIDADAFYDKNTKLQMSAVDALNIALPLENFNPF